MPKKVMTAAAALLLLLLLSGVSLNFVSLGKKEITVVIPRHFTSGEIAARLYSSGVIMNPLLFKLYIHFKGYEKKLRSGCYAFTSYESIVKVARQMRSGAQLPQGLTVPEGLTLRQTADLVEKKGFGSAERFLRIASDYIIPYAGVKGPLEGYLYPDTYKLYLNQGEEEIISAMLARFRYVFTGEMLDRARDMNLSVREVIIIASIIEKEYAVEDELPLISAVFHNRLKENRHLESCATVLYALGKHKSQLLYEDLEVESPYNTYKNLGLPPGPICSPGKKAIRAALYPANAAYRFFVSKADGSGRHTFTSTFSQHNRAIRFIKNANKKKKNR